MGVFGLMLGVFLATLDAQIVSTALPSIVGDLGGLDRFSWSVTAYLLTMAASTPIWGKLGDLYSRKGAYLSSVVVFLAGSVMCGLAQNMDQLIAYRAFQGLGAGGLMVGALSAIGVLVPPQDRGRVQSTVGVMLPVAFVGGPLLGGLLTDAVSWRLTFYVNVPVGLVALAAVGWGVDLRTERVKTRIDVLGAALLTVAVLALTLLASTGGTAYDWLSPQVVGCAVVAAVALAGFVRVERGTAEPIIPPHLFRSRAFSLAQVLSFLVGAVMVSVMNYLPQYMQFVQGTSSTLSGLLLLPMMLGMLTAQLSVGKLMDQGVPDRPDGLVPLLPLVGAAITAAGALLLLVLDPDTALVLASALTLLVGVGIGVLMQSTLLTTMNSAAPRDMGAATGTVTLVRTIGGSLGVAVLGAVGTSRMNNVLAQRLGAPEATLLTSEGLTPDQLDDLPVPVRDAVEHAVANGLDGVLHGVTVLAAIAILAACLVRSGLPREPVRTSRRKYSAP